MNLRRKVIGSIAIGPCVEENDRGWHLQPAQTFAHKDGKITLETNPQGRWFGRVSWEKTDG